jgi:hypothetical protein
VSVPSVLSVVRRAPSVPAFWLDPVVALLVPGDAVVVVLLVVVGDVADDVPVSPGVTAVGVDVVPVEPVPVGVVDVLPVGAVPPWVPTGVAVVGLVSVAELVRGSGVAVAAGLLDVPPAAAPSGVDPTGADPPDTAPPSGVTPTVVPPPGPGVGVAVEPGAWSVVPDVLPDCWPEVVSVLPDPATSPVEPPASVPGDGLVPVASVP